MRAITAVVQTVAWSCEVSRLTGEVVAFLAMDLPIPDKLCDDFNAACIHCLQSLAVVGMDLDQQPFVAVKQQSNQPINQEKERDH